MYTLMLVDDHKIILDGIQMMIQGMDVAFDRFICASNGQEALELLERERPDAVITDIRMPAMDGLSFCKTVRGMKNDIPIILLTGYDDFEYARQGIEIQAVCYLLKPVEKDELFAALKTVELMLDEQAGRTLEACSENASVIIRAVNGEKLLKTFHQQMALYHFLPRGEAVSKELARQVKELFGQSLLSIYVRASEILCLAQWDEERRFPPELSDRVEINVSSMFEGLDYLGDALRQLYIVHIKRSGRRESQALSFEEVSHPGESLKTPSNGELEEINNAIAFFDRDRLDKALNRLDDKLASQKNAEEIAAAWYSSVCMSVYKHFYEHISKPNMSEEFNYLLYGELLLAKERSRENMARFMRERLHVFLAKLCENNKESVVEKAKALLKENPGRSQQELADALHISSQYFSRLFRRETGESFSGYSIRLRIETAKKCLTTSGLTVEQIGKKVGYDSEKHFYTVFRKMTGMSPAQYRRLHSKQ
ncbi:MAG: response regulator [Oscillospiraceae bacterium]|jgi:two-component system response regulator YesN|nr:response regulator [Oscillospiraceae bacterium]